MSVSRLLLASLILFTSSVVLGNDYEFKTQSDVYVLGDIHGAYKELIQTLTTAKLVDEELNWTGSDSHLVSLGDLMDRGPNSRAVIDLLRKLQKQAKSAGGQVHVVLGNHEVMNLQGDWRYLSPEEVSAFAKEETQEQRDEAYQIFLRSFRIEDSEQNQSKFNSLYPAGFFAHIKAYHRKGDYGTWLLEQPFLIKINQHMFTHGGLSPKLAKMDLEEINEEQKDSLQDYLKVWEYYLEEQVLTFNTPFFQRPDFVNLTKKDRKYKSFMKSHESLIFSSFSTTWYRGNAMCHPFFEEDRLKGQLKDLEAGTLWVGHTTTQSKQVETRLSGTLTIMDTGMLAAYYRGTPYIARIQADGNIDFIHGVTGDKVTPGQSPVRDYVNPFRWSDKKVEDFLRTADVVEIEKTEEGQTNPLRLTLKKGKRVIKGIFKYRDSDPLTERLRWRNSANESDRYHYEVAAYKLDRMLGIGIVPVTVEREIDGVEGVIQLWIDDLTSMLKENEKSREYDGMCDFTGQINFLDSFDYLIANRDRNQSNMLMSASDGQIWFIDHSRAFGTSTKRPKMLKKSKIKPTKRFKRALETLDNEKLQVLRPWLHQKQIDAILKRRDKMLIGKF